MRVALTITELHPGGAEKCLVNLAGFLRGRGHHVKLWQLWPDPPADRRQLTRELDELGIAWSSAGAVRAWDFPRAVWWLRGQLRQFQPDVVQAFLFHANVATALAASGLGAAVFGGVRVRQTQRLRGWLQRLAAMRMDKLVCVSRSVAQHCVRAEGIPAEKIEVIPNGIDAEFPFQPVSWNAFRIPSDAPVILFVGRLDPQKGIAEFMSRADSLLAALPTHHIVIMGDGPLASRLRQSRGQLKHGARVHLVGWQPRAIDWMRIAQVVVLPASYEGMPNVILEAMLAATAVAAFDVEGIQELIGDCQPQIVPAGNYAAFEQTVIQLCSDMRLRNHCGEHNRQRVRREFDLQHQLSRYETLYLNAKRL